MDISRKKCEGCGLKVASLGLPSEGTTRWCSDCATRHTPGVVDVAKRKAAAKKAAPKKQKAAKFSLSKAAPKKK